MTDKVGEPAEVGQRIVYCHRNELRLGVVHKVNPKTVHVKLPGWNENDPPYRQRWHIDQVPSDRYLILEGYLDEGD